MGSINKRRFRPYRFSAARSGFGVAAYTDMALSPPMAVDLKHTQYDPKALLLIRRGVA